MPTPTKDRIPDDDECKTYLEGIKLEQLTSSVFQKKPIKGRFVNLHGTNKSSVAQTTLRVMLGSSNKVHVTFFNSNGEKLPGTEHIKDVAGDTALNKKMALDAALKALGAQFGVEIKYPEE